MKNPILSENNWKTICDTEIDMAVLPWGATEAHNYHLPYGTDNYHSEIFAVKAAKSSAKFGFNVVVLPTVPFGVNTGQTDIKLTLNIYPSTQLAILKDITENIHRSGVKKLLIVNGHGGNDFKQMIREVNSQFPDLLIVTCNWFQAFDGDQFFSEPGDHADEAETSIMMYLKPELVLPLSEAGNGNNKKFRVDALNEKWAWAERKWTSVTKDTGIGNPANSSKEKGEKCFNYCVQEITKLMVDLCKLDLNDQYK